MRTLSARTYNIQPVGGEGLKTSVHSLLGYVESRWWNWGWLNTRRAAAFWICCRGLIAQAGSPAWSELQESRWEMTSAWTRSWAASLVTKGLIQRIFFSSLLLSSNPFFSALISLHALPAPLLSPIPSLQDFTNQVVVASAWPASPLSPDHYVERRPVFAFRSTGLVFTLRLEALHELLTIEKNRPCRYSTMLHWRNDCNNVKSPQCWLWPVVWRGVEQDYVSLKLWLNVDKQHCFITHIWFTCQSQRCSCKCLLSPCLSPNQLSQWWMSLWPTDESPNICVHIELWM